MKIRETLAKLDRVQHALAFKVIASVVVVALAVAAFSTYYVMVTLPGQERAAAAVAIPDPPPGQAAPELTAAERSSLEAAQRMYADLMSRRTAAGSVAVGVAALTLAALVVVWLGLGLTYLGLVGLAIGAAYPLALLGWKDTARLLLSILALTAGFTALMQGLRVLLSGSGPVFAVARNMLTEATRMKVSIVFIVMLIFAMAGLPGWLTPDIPEGAVNTGSPLRYRVQSFLQYGMSGSFWIIAVLVLFFSVASVAFEQRDKQIWQTMTKPVAAWQYILGKWIGVSGLAAVLLAVSAGGVFMFTEYLRQQPAVGESAHLVRSGEIGVSEDRMILENQVLSARLAVTPVVPYNMEDEGFKTAVAAYIRDQRSRDPEFATTQGMYDKVVSDLFKSLLLDWRAIPPNRDKLFMFRGLEAAKEANRPLSLRYKIDSGSNDPTASYRVTFMFNGTIHPPERFTLGQTHSLLLRPDVINEKGEIELGVYNGAFTPVSDAEYTREPNPTTISFPEGGLEVTYPAGTYQGNFVRVAFVLWVKLAFLAIVAITVATFLSFPVACLVAFATFLIAEGTGFLAKSLEYYSAADSGGNVQLWKVPVRAIGLGVAWMFKTYSDLDPIAKLVDGRLLDVASVAWGTLVLVVWSGVLYVAAVTAMKRRELATYSGQ